MIRFFLSFFFIQAFCWGSEIQIPALRTPVMDEVGLLTESEQEDLNRLAYEIHTHQGPQISILTLKDLQGYEIEDFSIRVVEKWQLGSKEKDNGLLILIAKAERKMRIEVGNGIEGEITDYDSHQYIEQVLKPAFRQGQYHAGLRLILQDIAKKFNIPIENKSGFIRRAARPQVQVKIPEGFKTAFPFIIIIFIVSQIILRNSPRARGALTGLTFSSLGFFLGAGFFLLFALFIVGMAIGLMGLHNLLYALYSAQGNHHGGGFGHYGGSSGGSGGWSGGGGGFSGGGSSGNW